jgi:hypothetical protein
MFSAPLVSLVVHGDCVAVNRGADFVKHRGWT